MAKKHVCVSFDYENDKKYYFLLKAWDKNPYIDFHISDCTPNEIQSSSVDVIKQVLSKKIGKANYMIAIMGEKSCNKHKDSEKIGYKNWQAYEIAKNMEKGNKLVVVRLNDDCKILKEAFGVGAKILLGFDSSKIQNALKELAKV